MFCSTNKTYILCPSHLEILCPSHLLSCHPCWDSMSTPSLIARVCICKWFQRLSELLFHVPHQIPSANKKTASGRFENSPKGTCPAYCRAPWVFLPESRPLGLELMYSLHLLTGARGRDQMIKSSILKILGVFTWGDCLFKTFWQLDGFIKAIDP